MLGAHLVSEMVARKDRGAGIQTDCARVRGGSQDRQALVEARGVAVAVKCAPEVDLNGAVRYRELQGLKLTTLLNSNCR
jgi:hypothetical protein